MADCRYVLVPYVDIYNDNYKNKRENVILLRQHTYIFLYPWHSCGTLFLRTFWHEVRLNISDLVYFNVIV